MPDAGRVSSALRTLARGSTVGRRLHVGVRLEDYRHDWIRDQCAQIPAGHLLLDVGAGAQIARPWCEHLRYLAQDLADFEPGGDGRGLQNRSWDYGRLDVLGDMLALPIADGSVDVVLCSEVLEHIPDPVAGLREITRVVRPGGELLLTAPFWSITHFAPHHYAVGFNRYFYEHHLPRLGFDIVELEASGTFFSAVAVELRRTRTVADTYEAGRVGGLARVASAIAIHALGRLSERGAASSELLAHHWFVRARRHAR